MGRKRTGSQAPLAKLRHGAVWHVTLRRLRPRKATDISDAWDTKDDVFNALVLITLPYREWPKTRDWYYRSRIRVGDLRRRLPEEALDDFRRLLRQTPPVQRNWRGNLERCKENLGHNYELLWNHEVTRLST